MSVCKLEDTEHTGNADVTRRQDVANYSNGAFYDRRLNIHTFFVLGIKVIN